MHSAPQTTPAPILRAANELGPQSVPFHVPRDLVKIVVFFDRKRLVATAVQMPVTDASPVFLPIPYMGNRELLHEGRQVALVFRPKHHGWT
jgi:hypothetical protein